MPLSSEDTLALTVDIYMVLLRYAVKDDTLTRLMDNIARSIHHSEQICDEAAKQDDQFYVDDICDEECSYIEDLLRASFIVIQTKISRVSSRVSSLNEQLRGFDLNIPEFDTQPAVLTLGGNYKDTGSTLVQLIWDIGKLLQAPGRVASRGMGR
jgi:hypothetical protein